MSGTTAWGRVWLRLAEPLTVTRPDPQLPRARSLARGGRVGAWEAASGRIAAVVDDGGPRVVHLTFPTWPDGTPGVALPPDTSGDLPDDLVERLAAAGTPVAPAAADVHATCDCGRNRCRHVLATLVETSRRVDESPATALRLRGVAAAGGTPADRTRVRVADLDPATFWTEPFCPGRA